MDSGSLIVVLVKRMEGKEKMLPLKLVRSLVLGETMNNAHTHTHSNPKSAPAPYLNTHTHDDDEQCNNAHVPSQSHHRTRRRRSKKSTHQSNTTTSDKLVKPKTPALVFLPTKEIITNTYRLATIAREMGMNLHPTPSLSHIIFSNSPSSFSSTLSFSSSSASWSLPNDAVAVPFPSLATATLPHLRCFVTLSKGFFKLVFFSSQRDAAVECDGGNDGDWDCCTVSLYSRFAGDRIETMEGFCRALAGKGWTFFKTRKNPTVDPRDGAIHGGSGGSVYLFRRVDVNRVRVTRVGPASGVGASGGACRVRELRLPTLDFRNAPLRILQYIMLMTDDIFCLA